VYDGGYQLILMLGFDISVPSFTGYDIPEGMAHKRTVTMFDD